jgi:hypothetical protein
MHIDWVLRGFPQTFQDSANFVVLYFSQRLTDALLIKTYYSLLNTFVVEFILPSYLRLNCLASGCYGVQPLSLG